MWIIFNFFWRICLLRASPENIPSSRALTLSLLGAYTVLSLITLYFIKSEITILNGLTAISVEVLIEASLVYSLLFFKGVRNRFFSTFAALLGTNILLTAIILPLNILLINMAEGLLADFLEAISIVIFFWWLSVIGFILNKSSNISMMQGVILAFIIELLVVIFVKSLIPDFY